jgi:hypothetical protein
MSKRKLPINEYPLYLVEWHDAATHTEGWTDPTSICIKPMRCVSVGYQVKQDKKTIIIVPSLSRIDNDPINRRCSDGIQIPKGCIVRKHRLGRQDK